jgi:hypothetical protein
MMTKEKRGTGHELDLQNVVHQGKFRGNKGESGIMSTAAASASHVGTKLDGLANSIEDSTKEIVSSNVVLIASNERHTKWVKWLTLALIFTTLFVGLTQAFVIWHTRVVHESERSGEDSTPDQNEFVPNQ